MADISLRFHDLCLQAKLQCPIIDASYDKTNFVVSMTPDPAATQTQINALNAFIAANPNWATTATPREQAIQLVRNLMQQARGSWTVANCEDMCRALVHYVTNAG